MSALFERVVTKLAALIERPSLLGFLERATIGAQGGPLSSITRVSRHHTMGFMSHLACD